MSERSTFTLTAMSQDVTPAPNISHNQGIRKERTYDIYFYLFIRDAKLFQKFPNTSLHVIGLNCHIITSHYTKVEKMSNQFFQPLRWKITNVTGADKKSYDKPDSMLKSRDITLPTNIHLVKAVVFPVVVYRCESWTIKKAECRRIDTFELCGVGEDS